MRQKDKELLLKDLSARLPYNLKGKVYAKELEELVTKLKEK